MELVGIGRAHSRKFYKMDCHQPYDKLCKEIYPGDLVSLSVNHNSMNEIELQNDGSCRFYLRNAQRRSDPIGCVLSVIQHYDSICTGAYVLTHSYVGWIYIADSVKEIECLNEPR